MDGTFGKFFDFTLDPSVLAHTMHWRLKEGAV
jgi:hypothetical protein